MANDKLTKSQYLNWIKECTDIDYEDVGDLGDGYAYCKLLDFLYPGMVDMKDVSLSVTKNEVSATKNLRVIEDCCRDLNIAKQLDIYGMASFQPDPNLSFIQWFYNRFSDRVKVAKCLQAAKKVKNLKRIEADEVAKIFEAEKQHEEHLILKQKESESAEEEVKKQFHLEDVKAKEAEQAVQDAIKIAGNLKDLVENSLNNEISLAAENTKAKIYSTQGTRETERYRDSDDVKANIEEVVRSREYAITAIEDFADQHTTAVLASKRAKDAAAEASAAVIEQTARTQNANAIFDAKNREYEKAVEAVKYANYAVAVLDAYDNSDDLYKTRAKKDSTSALKRVEAALDEFNVIKRTSINLRVFTGINE